MERALSAFRVGVGLIGLALVAALVVHVRTSPRSGKALDVRSAEAEGVLREGGFISIPVPDEMSSSGVVIFAPRDCPSEAAHRAERLASFLKERGIGFTRLQSASYNSLTSKEEAQRVMAVMNGDIPIVYVNGRAKANPTPEEVEAEYRRSDS